MTGFDYIVLLIVGIAAAGGFIGVSVGLFCCKFGNVSTGFFLIRAIALTLNRLRAGP